MQINIRIKEKEAAELKKLAAEKGVTVSAYVRSKACACGESGYEGIFCAISWTCAACGKRNNWRKK